MVTSSFFKGLRHTFSTTHQVFFLFRAKKKERAIFDNLLLFLIIGQQDPYTVLLQLGNQLREPLAPSAALETVAKTIKEALRLPYVEIAMFRNGQSLQVASAGNPMPDPLILPLISGGEEIGTLIVAPRSPGETFTDADERMLGVISRHVSTILQSAKQSMEIGLLIDELQHSREQLILAREEERRTMRNNLHDEIAPRLASLKLIASLVEDSVRDGITA